MMPKSQPTLLNPMEMEPITVKPTISRKCGGKRRQPRYRLAKHAKCCNGTPYAGDERKSWMPLGVADI